MSFIVWGLVGLLSGVIAKAVYPGNQHFNIFGTTILGILGSFLGGVIGTAVLGVNVPIGVLTLPSLGLAILGSVLLIFLYGLAAK